MGQSTDAILVFGMTIDEMEVEEEAMWAVDDTLDKRKSPVRMVRHCSCDYPMWILGIEQSKQLAWRGSPTRVDPTELFSNEDWPLWIMQTAKEFDIAVDPDRINWWLASDWC